jgi:nucleoid-associated protein YgaU
MSKDYRMGLVVGVVLAVAALIWVATRSSLTPRLPPIQASKGGYQVLFGADNPVASQNAGSASEANGPTLDEPSRATRKGKPAVLREPSSDPPDLTVFQRSEPIKTTKFHIVRQGETLSAIAQQYYGSPNNWRKILIRNEKAVKDANKIAPGTKLIIPD